MARKDWKKQLLRVKQIADQNLGRVEKTEALTADLQALEKKVEQFGKVYYTAGKKLQACLQSHSSHDEEKRQRKLPHYALGVSLLEGSAHLGMESLLGQVFQICGESEMKIAKATLDLDINIEKQVLLPIHVLLETDIPAIQKHKKTLQRMVLDMDSAKTRYQSAHKQQVAGGNNAASSAKVDTLRDEYEETCYKVDQCRDQLATEMFTLASKEAALSQLILDLAKCQAEYHRHSLECLQQRIPRMEEQVEFWSHMPVFGQSLSDHLRRTDREIALVIEECVKNICMQGGLEEEGLFRIAGAANKVKKLKAAFNSEQVADIAEEYDVPCIAGAFKLYLRELPDPLMTCALYPDWMQAAHLPADQRLPALAEVISRLPKPNYDNLRYLIKFLSKLAEFQEINKMSASNIAIVMGPNLIWQQGENGPSVLTTSSQSAIVETLITHSDYFFPGDLDFLKSSNKSAGPPLDILRPKPVSSLGVINGGSRHGINAGLSMAHQSLIVPVSASVQASSPSQSHDGSPEPSGLPGDANRPRLTSGSRSNSEADSNDEDIFEIVVSDSTQPVVPEAPPDLLNSVPPASYTPSQPQRVSTSELASQGPPGHNLIGALHAASNPFGPPDENMTASTDSLQFSEGKDQGSISPKPPKRINKKPAPLPPMERPTAPAPLPPVQSPPVIAEKPPSAAIEKNLPYPVKPPVLSQYEGVPATAPKPDRPPGPPPDRPAEKPDRPADKPQVVMEKPDRPHQPVLEKPDRPQQPDKPERPGKPDKPSKPDKPNVGPGGEKLYPTLSTFTTPQRSSPPQTARQVHTPEVSEKPPVPPPPTVKPDTPPVAPQSQPEPGGGSPAQGHKRQGSSGTRPPRPQLPPPPPATAKTSPSPTVAIQEERDSEKMPAPDNMPETPTKALDPNEQTYL